MSRYGESEQSYREECLFETVKDFLKEYSVSALFEVISDALREIERNT